MRAPLFVFFIYFALVECKLWPKGVVHYDINPSDYDINSQDLITNTLQAVEREICVKFFKSPLNSTRSEPDRKIVYFTNPTKTRDCNRQFNLNFSHNILDMTIGYNCLKKEDIAQMMVDMLRASIDQNSSPVNSIDLKNKFDAQEHDGTSILSPIDRNYINSYYFAECGELKSRPVISARRKDANGGTRAFGDVYYSEDNRAYYLRKTWPQGLIFYNVDYNLLGTPSHVKLREAMIEIETHSCVIFREYEKTDAIIPNNALVFGSSGTPMAIPGFSQGHQSIHLDAFVQGDPGHEARTILNLMRAIGVPIMANRYDRDNYVNINWKNIAAGHEHIMEKAPWGAWIDGIPYDFDSVTHPPANFLCLDCRLGQMTIQPILDHLWQRSLNMGHNTKLSKWDKKLLELIYAEPCSER